MSPKVADPAVRTALIEQAARIIAEEGHDALSLRKLAAAVGASTMAVYTHFGSMDDLRREVRREGFARLSAHMDAVEETGDSVADLLVCGAAYYLNAVTNPNLYRVMFMERPLDESDREVGIDTFARLIHGVERCIEAGRFDRAEPLHLATQIWAFEHGIVALALAGMLPMEDTNDVVQAAGRTLFSAFGDSPAALSRSFNRALPRTAELVAEGGSPPAR